MMKEPADTYSAETSHLGQFLLFAAAVLLTLAMLTSFLQRSSVLLSNSNSGDTMAEVYRYLAASSEEILVAFDNEGKKLFEYTNHEPNSVDFSAAHCDFMRDHAHELTLVHNHPNGSTFSAQDIVTAAELGVARMVVITDDYVYTLRPKAESWGDPKAIAQFYETARYDYISNPTDDSVTIAEDWTDEFILRSVAEEFQLSYRKNDLQRVLSRLEY